MKVKTIYLQMFARPERVEPPPRDGLVVVHARKPTVTYYRYLYDAVGRDYDWTSRKKLSDAELAALLNDPRLEVHVLIHRNPSGVRAGFPALGPLTSAAPRVRRVAVGPAGSTRNQARLSITSQQRSRQLCQPPAGLPLS